MIIDKLKEFIVKLTGTHQKNNDCIEENSALKEVLRNNPKCEENINGEKPALKPDMGIQNVYGARIPGDKIDEPTPCVYGPPSLYIEGPTTTVPE